MASLLFHTRRAIMQFPVVKQSNRNNKPYPEKLITRSSICAQLENIYRNTKNNTCWSLRLSPRFISSTAGRLFLFILPHLKASPFPSYSFLSLLKTHTLVGSHGEPLWAFRGAVRLLILFHFGAGSDQHLPPEVMKLNYTSKKRKKSFLNLVSPTRKHFMILTFLKSVPFTKVELLLCYHFIMLYIQKEEKMTFILSIIELFMFLLN